jgi:WD40 repeat protein
MVVQLDNSRDVTDLAWSPDGKFYAAGTRQGEIKFWSPDGRLLKIIHAGSSVHSIAISPDGKTIAHQQTMPEGGSLVLRDRSGKITASLLTNIGFRGIVFDPGGRFVACRDRGEISIIGVDGRLIKSLRPPAGREFHHVSLYSAGRKAAAVIFNYDFPGRGTARARTVIRVDTMLWSLDGSSVRTVEGEAVFSPDGTHLASVTGGDTLKLYDGEMNLRESISLPAKNRMREHSITLPESYPLFSADGRRIAFVVGTRDGKAEARVCRRDGGLLQRLAPPGVSGLPMLAFSPDGGRLAWFGEGLHGGNQRLVIWDATSGQMALSSALPDASSSIGPGGSALTGDGRSLVEMRAKRVMLWDLSSGALSWNRHVNPEEEIQYGPFVSPDAERIAYSTFKMTPPHRWFSLLMDLKGESLAVSPRYISKGPSYQGTCSPDGSRIANLSCSRDIDYDCEISFWTRDGIPAGSIPLPRKRLIEYAIAPDWKTVATVTSDGEVVLRGLDGAIIRKFTVEKSFTHARFTPDLKQLVTMGKSFSVQMYDMHTGRHTRSNLGGPLSVNDRPFEMRMMQINASGTRLLAEGRVPTGTDINLIHLDLDNRKTVDDYWSWKQLNAFHTEGRFDTSFFFSPDGKSIASFSSKHKHVNLWDDRGRHQKKIGDSGAMVKGALFSADGRYLHIRLENHATRIIDLSTGESCYLLENGGEWIVYTPDGYFDGSPGCGRLIAMVQEMKAFGVEQFALKYNRPDIILRRMGFGAPDAIAHLHGQYLRRLRRMGLAEGDLSDELHVPVAHIKEVKQNFTADRGRVAELLVHFKDTRQPLAAYQVYVNEVPIFGETGKAVSGKEAAITERVELAHGRNKIEVSCRNRRGAESLRALSFAEYRGPGKGDLYFIGFGVSKYRDGSLDLKYAHKDAMDLGKTFEKMGALYNKVHVKTFLDNEVTAENIRKSKDFFRDAKVDDTAVLFVAGHGLHDTDRESTYYYLTHDANVNNLKGTAADFDLLEDLFHGIAPRNRLLLMDTCESGEGDENLGDAGDDKMSRGIRARTTRALAITMKKKREGKPHEFLRKKDRYIYNDLKRRTGAIVLSSSRGGELSYESDEYRNGLFTKEIVAGLSGKADADGDGKISSDELRAHVAKAVPKISGNKQHPTVDRDNLFMKIVLPAVR